MLDLVRTKIVDSAEYPLYSLAPNGIAEGTAMIMTNVGGQGQVTPAAGSSNNDIFAGFSFNYFNPLDTAVSVESVLAAGGTQTYTTQQGTPLTPSTTTLLKGSTTGAFSYNAGLAAGQYSVTTNVLSFNSATAGETVTFTYRYNLTATQARFIQGDVYYGTTGSSTVTGTMGIIRRGFVYTTLFDPSVDWTGTVTLKAGANGYIVNGGTGATLPAGAYVIQAPTGDIPFLGLFIN